MPSDILTTGNSVHTVWSMKKLASILCFQIYSLLAILCLCCAQVCSIKKWRAFCASTYTHCWSFCAQGLIHEKSGEHFVLPDILTTATLRLCCAQVCSMKELASILCFQIYSLLVILCLRFDPWKNRRAFCTHYWPFCAYASPRFDPWEKWRAFCASTYTHYWPFCAYAAPTGSQGLIHEKIGELFVLPYIRPHWPFCAYAAPRFDPWKNGEHFVLPDTPTTGHFVQMLRPGSSHEKIGQHFVLPDILTIGHF